jgi:hypothetical protein
MLIALHLGSPENIVSLTKAKRSLSDFGASG